MPNQWEPVRPKPVCTSSQMKTPPYCFAISVTMPKYSSGGVMKPPTPWMGSAMKAAILPLVVVRITSSTSWAQATPHSG